MYFLSLVFAVIGLSILYLTTVYWEPQTVEIGEVESSMVGDVVKVEGKIANFSHFDGNSFFDLKSGNRSLKVVKFDSDPEFGNGDKVTVEGEIAIYQGEMEIIADTIE